MLRNYIHDIFLKTNETLFGAVLLALLLAAVPRARAEYFRHLSLADGLSQPSVIAVCQDQLGRMWIGTREGVNVYDGMSVIPYKGWVDDPAGEGKVWIGNSVRAITDTSRGDLFIIMDYNVVKYDIRTDRFSRLTDSGDIRVMATSGDVTTFMSQFSAYETSAGSDSIRFLFKLPPLADVMHLAMDGDKYYISTARGLHVIDRATRRETVLLPDEGIYSTFIGRNKAVWICAANGGLYRKGINEPTPELVSMPEAPKSVAGAKQSRHAVEDADGRIWYGSFTGLYCYDPSTKQTRHVKVSAGSGGLSHSSLFGMCCDRRGNIWAGTYFGGVNYFRPGQDYYSNFDYEGLVPEGLHHSYINSMVRDRDGRLWFGTDGAGVCCLDRQTNVVRQITAGDGKNSLRQNNIKSLAYDARSNRLFIGTHLGGLSVCDLDRGTTVNLIDRPGEDVIGPVIHSMKIYGDRLYVASRRGLFSISLDDSALSPRRITSRVIPYRFDFDSEGNIYASARFLNRIYKITGVAEGNVTVRTFTELGELGSFPTSICCNADGLLAGTLGNGVMVFPQYKSEGRRVLSTSTSDMPDDYCYAMEKTADGEVYILTNSYLVRYRSVEQPLESLLFSEYFPGSRIIDECGLMADDNGDIHIGSTKGITRLSRDCFVKDKEPSGTSGLFFSHLKVYDVPISPCDGSKILAQALPFASEIHLPHDRTNLSISIGMNDYTRARALPRIEYRLEGNDSHWLSSKDGNITYNSIEPGDYTLRVRNEGGKDEISIRIRVAHPWYDTWMAWLLYISLGLAVAFYIWRKNYIAARLRTSLMKEQVERRQIETLNHEKLVFFTNVSHEFQTPLTLIMSHVDFLISKYGRNEKLLETLKSVRRYTLQMSHLITQLLEFRKLQQNHQVLRLAYHDAAESLRQNAMPFVDYAHQRNIDYTIDIPEGTPLMGFYDTAMLDRVLVNIISNAFKYTPDGGKISCSVRSGREGTVVFQVSDNGRGISEKDLPYIFDRFYNGAPEEIRSSAIDYRSTGIGLAFAKSIVDKHHGEITVRSRRGEGSVFTVVIPATPAAYAGDENVIYEEETDVPDDSPEVAVPQTEGMEEEQAEPEAEKPLVLIVEDNEELRHNLVRFFENYFRVAEAEDGEDGLAKARSLNPDVIISDVMMPGMDGTEMCRRIKSDISLSHIPVILLTALSTSESKIAGLNANADDYVTKPFESAVLLARVDNLIRNRNMLRRQFGGKPVDDINMSAVNPLDRSLIKRITNYIDEHVSDQNLDIHSLCVELGLSRSLFYNKFKSLTGMTPNAFILNYRLKYAASLLRGQNDLTITEISDRCGFSNATYFSRCFRKQFGIAPAHYRK